MVSHGSDASREGNIPPPVTLARLLTELAALPPEQRAAIAALLANWQDVPPRFTSQMARFHDALTNGTALPVTTADARRSLEIVTAFYASSRTKQEVTFPIGPEHPNYQSWLPEGFA